MMTEESVAVVCSLKSVLGKYFHKKSTISSVSCVTRPNLTYFYVIQALFATSSSTYSLGYINLIPCNTVSFGSALYVLVELSLNLLFNNDRNTKLISIS